MREKKTLNTSRGADEGQIRVWLILHVAKVQNQAKLPSLAIHRRLTTHTREKARDPADAFLPRSHELLYTAITHLVTRPDHPKAQKKLGRQLAHGH